jgi:aspartyl-tRNA(Asn)/glutamyl-tRNA(Gln) amidotransferase subunit C
MGKDKKISIEEVEHIANLARIDLEPSEKEKLSSELSNIIGYIEKLQEADTDNVEPISQVTGMVNVMRDDISKDCDEKTRKIIFSNFPEGQDGYIKVKQIL